VTENDIHSRHLAAALAIVRAYVTNNKLPPGEIPGLLRLVHATLLSIVGETRPGPQAADTERPDNKAMRASVRPDGLVSFINGRSYKTLKRHLTAHGLDPVSYRERYGLPADYPMVASAYSEWRSRLAKKIGLGVPYQMPAEAVAPARATPRR